MSPPLSLVDHLAFVAVSFALNFVGTMIGFVYLHVQLPSRGKNTEDYSTGVLFYNAILMPFVTYFSVCLGNEACFGGTAAEEGLGIASAVLNAFNIVALLFFLRFPSYFPVFTIPYPKFLSELNLSGDSKIAELGGPIYAFWQDKGVCCFGFWCPVWQLSEATAEAINGSCLVNCVVLVWCPGFGHCCVAKDLSIVNVRWGGRPDCLYRYFCILCCPQLSSMQLARAVKRRRAMNAGYGEMVTPFSSTPLVKVDAAEKV